MVAVALFTLLMHVKQMIGAVLDAGIVAACSGWVIDSCISTAQVDNATRLSLAIRPLYNRCA